MYIRTGSSRGSKRRSVLVFGFGGCGLFVCVRLDNLNVQVVELEIELVQIIGGQTFRQNVIEVLAGELTLLVGQVDEGFQELGQPHRLGRCGRGGGWPGQRVDCAIQRVFKTGALLLEPAGHFGLFSLQHCTQAFQSR